MSKDNFHPYILMLPQEVEEISSVKLLEYLLQSLEIAPLDELNLTLRLRELARDIYRCWDELDNQIEVSSKVPLASLPIDYHNVEDPRIFTKFQLKIEKGEENSILQPYFFYIFAYQRK